MLVLQINRSIIDLFNVAFPERNAECLELIRSVDKYCVYGFIDHNTKTVLLTYINGTFIYSIECDIKNIKYYKRFIYELSVAHRELVKLYIYDNAGKAKLYTKMIDGKFCICINGNSMILCVKFVQLIDKNVIELYDANERIGVFNMKDCTLLKDYLTNLVAT